MVEEREMQRIHVSSGLFSQVLKGHFWFGSSSFPVRAAPSQPEERRRRWMDVGGEERGCWAFLLLEARALAAQNTSTHTLYFRQTFSKIKAQIKIIIIKTLETHTGRIYCGGMGCHLNLHSVLFKNKLSFKSKTEPTVQFNDILCKFKYVIKLLHT